GADFTRHARHFRGKYAQLLNHGVDDVGGTQELPFERPPIHVQPDSLSEVALRHTRNGAGDFRSGTKQVLDERVDRPFHLAPCALRFMKPGTLPRSPFLAHNLPHPIQLLSHLLVNGDDLIECVSYLSSQPGPGARKAHGKITRPHSLQTCEYHGQIRRHRFVSQAGATVVLRTLFNGIHAEASRVTVASLHDRLQTGKYL